MDKLKRKLLILIASFAGFALVLLWSEWRVHGSGINIGAKNCTEQHLLSEMFAQIIETKTDLPVNRKFNLEGTTICFHALKSGDIDFYCEYTGTALVDILHIDPKSIAEPTLTYLEREFQKKYQLRWLSPIGFNNTYVFAMLPELAQTDQIFTLSDLIRSQCLIATDPEFVSRPEFSLLKQAYNLPQDWKPLQMDQALLYLTLSKKSVQAVTGFSTDSAIEKYHLTLLRDDQHCFPVYDVVPLIREEILQKYPALAILLNSLQGKISEEMMRSLNAQVEQNGRSVPQVAREFLLSQKLL